MQVQDDYTFKKASWLASKTMTKYINMAQGPWRLQVIIV